MRSAGLPALRYHVGARFHREMTMKLILAATLALLAAPAFAQDPATMTCKDMMGMDATGMATAGTAMKGAMSGDAKMSAMADADVTKMAEDACKTYADATVMDAMHMSAMMTMTCKDMMAMDKAGMASAGMTMKMAMKDDAKMAAMADADLTKKAGDACTAHPDATVMDAMKM